jgi:hypothetical protein
MQKNPSATITLVGSSNNSNSDGLTMAESVKTYLVNTFAINASRITTKVKTNPIYHLNNQEERKNYYYVKGDRRVSIESNSDLLMEFQSGPNAPLKPVQIIASQPQLKVMLLLIIKELEKPYRHGLYS